MVRQHVNPLSRFYQQPLALPPLAALFSEPDRPLHLDIGSARGRFLLEMARLHPGRNQLGLEIRRTLVSAAEADRQAAGLSNLHYLFANANVSLGPWLSQLPRGLLQLVTLQFPDPWFKKRHHKRRVLQPGLLLALIEALQEGTQLFLQSDVPSLITPMLALIEASGCFQPAGNGASPWLTQNPLPVPSEREVHVQALGLPVLRVLLTRTAAAAPSLALLEAAAEAADCEALPAGDRAGSAAHNPVVPTRG